MIGPSPVSARVAATGGEGEKRAWPSIAAILLLGVPALFHAIDAKEVCEVIEERVAVTSREMWRAGEWVLPTMNGEPRLQKPPLAYWLPHALASARGSFDELTLRLPFALAGLAAAFVTFGIGRLVLGTRTGLLAGAILISTPLFLRGSHTASADILLLLWTAAAWLFLLRARLRAAAGARAGWEPLAFYACLGLGALTKGPLILLFTLLPLLLEAAAARSTRPLRPLGSPAGIAIFLLVSFSWPVLVELRLPPDATTMSPLRQWILESLGKVMPSEGIEEGYRYQGHRQPWHYYLTRLLPAFGIWAPVILLALLDVVRGGISRLRPRALPGGGEREAAARAPSLLRPIRLWCVAPLVLFSAVAEKKIAYVLPVMPAGAVLVAAAVERWYPRMRPALRFLTLVAAAAGAAGVVLLVAWAALPIDPGGVLDRLGAHPSLAGAVLERIGGAIFAAAAACAGALLVRRLLRENQPLLPALACVLAVSLAFIPIRDISIAVENEREGVRDLSLRLAAEIDAGRPLYAVEDLPSGMLFYLDRKVHFLAGSPEAIRAVPPGAALLATARELGRLGMEPDAAGGQGAGSLSGPLEGFAFTRAVNPGEPRARDRVLLFEKLPAAPTTRP
jgi:4-amino-4-deoxy-L-arabinose transferase-like glycosyltransferase